MSGQKAVRRQLRYNGKFNLLGRDKLRINKAQVASLERFCGCFRSFRRDAPGSTSCEHAFEQSE